MSEYFSPSEDVDEQQSLELMSESDEELFREDSDSDSDEGDNDFNVLGFGGFERQPEPELDTKTTKDESEETVEEGDRIKVPLGRDSFVKLHELESLPSASSDAFLRMDRSWVTSFNHSDAKFMRWAESVTGQFLERSQVLQSVLGSLKPSSNRSVHNARKWCWAVSGEISMVRVRISSAQTIKDLLDISSANLKEGDKVELFSSSGNWVKAQIVDVKEAGANVYSVVKDVPDQPANQSSKKKKKPKREKPPGTSVVDENTEPNDIVEALLREFMYRKGLGNILEAFDVARPRGDKTINSVKAIYVALQLQDIYKRMREEDKGVSVFEVLVAHSFKAPGGEDDAESKNNDSDSSASS